MVNYIKKLLKLAFPGSGASKDSIIVTTTNPYVGEGAYILEVLEEATLTAVDDALISGTYPSVLLTGVVTYGKFTNVTVTDGVVKLYLL